MSIYAVPVVIGIGYGVYMLVVMPRMKKKWDTQASAHKAEFTARIQGREQEEKQILLDDPEMFKPIGERLPGETITGLTSCMEKRNLKDMMKQGLRTGAVRMAWGMALGMVGIRVKYREVEDTTSYYLVLTDTKLHYMAFVDKQCKRHVPYQLTDLANVKLSKAGFGDTYQGGQMGAQKLTFTVNGEAEKIYFHDGIVRMPDNSLCAGLGAQNRDRFVVLGTLLQEPFKQGIEAFVASHTQPASLSAAS